MICFPKEKRDIIRRRRIVGVGRGTPAAAGEVFSHRRAGGHLPPFVRRVGLREDIESSPTDGFCFSFIRSRMVGAMRLFSGDRKGSPLPWFDVRSSYFPKGKYFMYHGTHHVLLPRTHHFISLPYRWIWFFVHPLPYGWCDAFVFG